MATYYNPNDNSEYTEAEIGNLTPENQGSIAKHWFHSNYMNPGEDLPYNSAEGGYIYLFGGPYDALQELSAEFSDSVADRTLDDVAGELGEITNFWSGRDDSDRYYESLADEIGSYEEYYYSYQSAVLDVESLFSIEIDDANKQTLSKLIFANLVTSLETYLGDAFLYTITNDHTNSHVRRFVETTNDFGNLKVKRSGAFGFLAEVHELVSKWLVFISWHNLDRIKVLYRNTLQIELDETLLNSLRPLISTRHDIVHRNGRTVEGNDVVILSEDVATLKELVDDLVTQAMRLC